MKSMFVVLTLIAANLMAAAEQESAVVGHVVAEQREVLTEKEQIDQRVNALTDLVKDFIVSYDDAYGKGLSDRFQKEWSRMIDEESSVNDAADKLLVSKICKLKDHQSEGKEIEPAELYTACLVYMKYQEEGLNIKFPSCFATILKSESLSKPIFDLIDSAKRTVKKIVKVEPLPVAAVAEKKGM